MEFTPDLDADPALVQGRVAARQWAGLTHYPPLGLSARRRSGRYTPGRMLPIGTDVRLRSRPIGNWLIISLNILLFAIETQRGSSWMDVFLPALDAAVPSLREYVTYQFRHGGVLHLLGNMLFLWVFGNAVCDRLGSLNYVVFYLAGGVFAGVLYALSSQTRMVGASGAIAAITTAFLVLYPRVQITVLMWFVVVMTLQIPAMLLIVGKIILWDNVLAMYLDQGVTSNVAFSAHIGGYLFGFVVTLLMLTIRALPRNSFDLLAVLERLRRRGQPGYFAPGRLARPVVAARPIQIEPTDEVSDMKSQIVDRLAERDLDEAIALYERLRDAAPDQAVLPRAAQLEVANQLAQRQRPVEAAQAYEDFLAAYPTAEDAAIVRLFLGMICRRYLHAPARALVHLQRAAIELASPAHRALAEQELASLADSQA